LPPPRSPPLGLRSRGFPRLKDQEKLRDFRKSLQGTVPRDRLLLLLAEPAGLAATGENKSLLQPHVLSFRLAGFSLVVIWSNRSRGCNARFTVNRRTVSVHRVPQMRGGGHADVLPVLQVPDNKADVVPCERLRYGRVQSSWKWLFGPPPRRRSPGRRA
jgi:hypothetical protein